jgi:hypothetical protein
MKKEKPSLSWNKKDYEAVGIEVPACVLSGRTEGEIMEPEEIISWATETLRCVKVLYEEYPVRAEEQIAEYKMDLNYLLSLGKIDEEQFEQLIDEENFNFG